MMSPNRHPGGQPASLPSMLAAKTLGWLCSGTSLLVLTCTVVTACHRTGSEPTAMQRDSAGIQIIDNASPVWTAPAWQVDSTPGLDLGGRGAAEPFQFEQLVDGAIEANGNIIAADRGRAQVLVYDEDGSFRMAIGRKGDGPGEFRGLIAVAATGDSIIAFDWRSARLSIFNAGTGQLLDAVQLKAPGDNRHPIYTYKMAGLADSTVVLAPWSFMPHHSGGNRVYWDSTAALLYGLNGRLIRRGAPYMGAEMYDGPRGATLRPFGAFFSVAVAKGYIYVGDGRNYDICVYRATGQLERIIRRHWTPRPVTDQDRSAEVEGYVRRAGFPSVDDPRATQLRRMLENAPFPRNMPAFLGLIVDDSGDVWVRRYEPIGTRIPAKWDVFDNRGYWLGTVQLPRNLHIYQIAGHRILGTWQDSLNVQHFGYYAIKRDTG